MSLKMKGFLLIFFFFFADEVYSQYIFRHLDLVDGLSDNQIRSISMLPDGRLGVRTASILNLYNGSTFEHFYQDRRKEYLWNYSKTPREYFDEKGRLWMKEVGYLLLLDLNNNEFIYNIDEELRSLGINKRLKDLFIEESKNYWFIAEDNTVYFYDIKAKTLLTITEGMDPFTEKFGIPYEITQYKNLYWIVYTSGLIRCWDYASREFVSQDTYFLNVINDATSRLYIHPTKTGDLWLMYNMGVFFYNRTDKTWKEVATISGPSNFYTCMDLDSTGNVWVGASRSGLRFIDGKTFRVETIPYIKINTGGMTDNDIHSVFVDENNGLWVGTLFQGLYYYHPSMLKFRLVHTVNNGTAITNEIVRCFLEDNDGSIWIGTANGLFRYNPETDRTEKLYQGIIDGLCLSLYRDRSNRIWVGTYMNGFFCIDGHNIKNFNKTSVNLDLYPDQNVSRAIYEDPSGRFWISAKNEGVGELNTETGEINMLNKKFPRIKYHRIIYNFYPVDDHVFAAYGEKGIFYYNTKTDSIRIPETDDPESAKFQDRNTKYYCVFKDSRSLEWFGTELGLRIWDNTGKKLYKIDLDGGLPNNSISGIQEDDNGMLWVSSVNGITRIEIKKEMDDYTFELLNFAVSDGLQSGKFYDGSSYKSKNGMLYFGGVHGFNVFNPETIEYNSSKNIPIFTSLKLFNTPIKENTEYNGHIILDQPVNRTKEILLNYKENFITIDFAGLNYVNPSRTYFRYKLENFDRDWTEITTEGSGSITYTGLPPGEYKLIVFTANNDKVWNNKPAEMNLIIKPPFWATPTAYILYLLLILFLVYFSLSYYLKRKKQKIIWQQKEELDQMKFRFFTNISHEFRTPLTLIMTPLSTLIAQEKNDHTKEKLLSVYKSAEDMLNLINQLLDFRKLEMGGEKLKLDFDDFIKFIEYIYVVFNETAINKGISFTFENDCKQLYIWFDKSKIKKIINNLYSNAIKFTPEGGHISTRIEFVQDAEDKFVKIEIADTGCGIPEKDLNAVFDRFYQGGNNKHDKAGSGIGLHLVREYVSLHKGKIEVSSKMNNGSVFSICIPVDLKGDEVADMTENTEVSEVEIKKTDSSSLKTILVIEDNEEFRRFLCGQLREKFNVLEAGDGEDGKKIAYNSSPDLIVSDLMMPKLDGLELCKLLKNDIQTSHIPIILLTARLSDEAKIESYKAGADSYISKPFNFEVLLTRIEMLIEQHEKRKSLFHKTIEITPSTITTTSLDEELVKKALLFVEKNISNPDYSVDDLSSDIALSRSQLYRKFQSILGLSPNEFIRLVRLKQAAQLLRDSQYNISEIAIMVGFNTIKYFNRYFKEEFGFTPTQYRAENVK